LEIQIVADSQLVEGLMETLSNWFAASASPEGRSSGLISFSPPEGSPVAELRHTVPLQGLGLLTVIEIADTVTQ
jgi:hypothetical protein